ncbi:response regulator [Insolitispirillum peregrinum]
MIEDDPNVGEFLRDFLQESSYTPILCHGVRQALDALSANPDIRVGLVDIHLTSMTGFDLLEHLKAQGTALEAVMMTGRSSCTPDLWRQAGELGVHDILQKPMDHGRLLAALVRAVRAAEQRQRITSLQNRLDQQARSVTRLSVSAAMAEARTMMPAAMPLEQGELSQAESILLERLVACARLRDDGTGAHCQRVGRYVRLLADETGLPPVLGEQMGWAAMLHDLGKIGVPDRLINKPGLLNPEEMIIMRGHAAIGHGLLEGTQHPVLQLAAEIALGHHEHFDGSGYPQGLRGEDIPLSARLTALCDVYDALRMQRPYKARLDHQAALRVLLQGDGYSCPQHFDPVLLAAFARIEQQFARIFDHDEDL